MACAPRDGAQTRFGETEYLSWVVKGVVWEFQLRLSRESKQNSMCIPTEGGKFDPTVGKLSAQWWRRPAGENVPRDTPSPRPPSPNFSAAPPSPHPPRPELQC